MSPRGVLILLALAAAAIPGRGGAGAGPTPPGYNVRLVRQTPAGWFWRGAAPTRETLLGLAAEARARGVPVTLVDLRAPARRDDGSGRGGRLSPAGEQALARALGLRYRAVSALDRTLTARLREWAAEGHVYLHCMYGVNRTGFAVGRYARAAGIRVDSRGLGKRDWRSGERFQASLERARGKGLAGKAAKLPG